MMAAHDEESRIAKCSTPTAFQAMLYSPVPTEPPLDFSHTLLTASS